MERREIEKRIEDGVSDAVRPANRFFPDGYAVWDWETRGFVRKGFTGQQLFETQEEAEEAAGPQQIVVKLTRPGEVESRRVRAQNPVQPEMCKPMLDIRAKIDGDLSDPETRIDAEIEMLEALGYPERSTFTTTRNGGHTNFIMLVKAPESEFWESIDGKIENLRAWAEESDSIEEPEMDLSITLNAGDPEMLIREIEAGRKV